MPTVIDARWYTLAVLDVAGGPMRKADIGRATGLDTGCLVGLVRDGLVDTIEEERKRRGRGPLRRVIGYVITDRGRAALRVAEKEAALYASGQWRRGGQAVLDVRACAHPGGCLDLAEPGRAMCRAHLDAAAERTRRYRGRQASRGVPQVDA